MLSLVRGAGSVNIVTNTVAGPTNGVEISSTNPLEFISDPLAAAITISGTITVNLWSLESSMTANVTYNVVIDKIAAVDGSLTRIATSSQTTETGTTAAAMNFTVTPTSTAMARGDRIRVRVISDDGGGNQASGFTGTFYYDGISGAQGESYVTFTENLTFDAWPTEGMALVQNQQQSANTLTASQVQLAQQFVAQDSTLTEIAFYGGKNSAPTDNLILEIQTDSGGLPSGTVVATIATIAGTSLTTANVLRTYRGSWSLTNGNTYWLVFRRSGAPDNTNNYYIYGWTGSTTGLTTYGIHNGTSWSSFSGAVMSGKIAFQKNALYYLTDTAETINPGSAIEKKALKTPGSSVVSSITNTAAGPTTGIQITNSAGGTAIEWYTPPLQAITLAGVVKFQLRALESNTGANAGLKCEVAVVNNDGTSPVIYGVGTLEQVQSVNSGGEVNSTTDAPFIGWLSGSGTISAGQRLRFRIYLDDLGSGPLVTGFTVSVSYNGNTPVASGDSNVVLPMAVTEQVPGVSAGNVAATSTVSGAVRLKPRITSGGISATSTVSGFIQILPLVLTVNAAVTVASANKADFIDPGAYTIKTNLVGTATGWGEMKSQGSAAAWPALGSEPSFGQGNGWIYDTTALEGKTLAAGTWTLKFQHALSVGSASANVVARIGKYKSGGTFQEIANSGPQSINPTTTPSSTTLNITGLQTAFATGDKLYIQIDVQLVTNSSGSGAATLNMYEGRGYPTGMWVTLSGYVQTVALAVANVNATSTVSGSVATLRKVAPAGISATSTVSGSAPKVQRAITPAGISATSTVSGNVRATHKVSGALSATSTISGRIGRRYALYLPGSLSLKNNAPLDDFNRAGTTSPPSANWSKLAVSGTSVDLALAGDSDSMVAQTAGFADGDYWNPSTFGPDTEVFVDIKELDAADDNQISLWVRGSGLGVSGTKTGYRLDWYPDGFSSINRVVNAASAQINGASQMGGTGQNQLNNGDSIGLQVLGTGAVVTLIAWFKPAGGNWYPLNVVQDIAGNRIVAAGNIGVQLYGPNASNPKQAITAFYGGTAVAAIVNAQIWSRVTIGGAVIKAGGPKPIPPAQISATSTISGSAAALRKIAPAQVSATSTVGGSVVAKRAITPAQIAATSTVSGSGVRVTRKIAPAAISATSTVSGVLAPKRGILPAAISATSTVSGAIVKGGGPKPISAAAISATSTVSGTVVALRKITPAQISATSTVSGSIVARRAVIPAQISATSTISGAIAPRRGILPAQIAATSTVSGNVRATKLIKPANVAATSTLSGNVIAIHRIGGALTATSTVTGAVRVTRAILPAQISATSTVSGNIRIGRAIVPAIIAATSTVSGLVGARRKITPAGISATSTVSGSVGRIPAGKYITPTTNINAFSTITGSFRRLAAVGGAVLATSTVSGALRALRRVSGALAATSTITGSVTARKAIVPVVVSATSTVSGAIKPLRGIVPAGISATSTITGRIVRKFLVLPAQILATSTISGVIGRRKPISPAAVAATSTIAGLPKLPIVHLLTGNVAATSTITGRFIRRIAVKGVISATSTVSGIVGVKGAARITPAPVLATSTISGKVIYKHVVRGQILATSTISGKVVRIVHLPGAISATSTIHGATVTIRVLRGNVLASSSIHGSILQGPVVYGRTIPRITSVATNGKATLVGVSSEIPILERVRVV